MGTHQSRFDGKGRTSIPAPFRAALRAAAPDGAAALVLRPSHRHPCIEGWPVSTFETLAAGVERMDLFSADQDDLTTALYADAWPLEPDKEGRIGLPEDLVAHAGLTDSALFMGLGRLFQIWEPTAGLARRAEARAGAVERSLTLPAARP